MNESAPAAFAYKPLYVQVKDQLVRRMIDGEWQPGQLIPSEMELARQVGVSQGTIRKALDAMTTENLLIRRQGRGTFVASPEESRILFQFFRIVPDSGETTFPDSRVLTSARSVAEGTEAEALGIREGDDLWRFERVRAIRDEPVLVETIRLPADRFPGFGDLPQIPNNVYGLYSQRWGITIARASERLKAVGATAGDAARLRCARGDPLLEITRIAYDLENKPVELRVSRCLTRTTHYTSELR
ncbi:GntR family transcriptional regulator [Nitratireductor mangrovi]|uniref:GntR family transcriptional regulator n=1 Tax=Nitratireductor mangrovi TaxID=2599600 RepID=A0A5B8L4S3_9HYPH|nr:GntR family transcriptional regulator [Nitratireductor mangrovi]QDZ02884.1 GntR family transcriptional regulator [Nitratireductor mangrovi]